MTKTLRNALAAIAVIVIAFLFAFLTGALNDILTRFGLEKWAQGITMPVPPAPETSVAETPAVQQPTPTADMVVPIFDLVRVEPSGDAVIAGQGLPQAEVEILSGASVIAKGKANGAGEWAIVLSDPLKPGAHDLTVRTTAPGQSPLVSKQSVAVSVPEGGEGEVLVVLNQPGSASTVLQVPGLAEAQKALRDAGVDPSAAAEAEASKPATTAAAPATETPKPADAATAPIEPAKPAETAEAPAPVETAKPVDTAEAPAPVEPAKPAEMAEAPAPVEPAKPAETASAADAPAASAASTTPPAASATSGDEQAASASAPPAAEPAETIVVAEAPAAADSAAQAAGETTVAANVPAQPAATLENSGTADGTAGAGSSVEAGTTADVPAPASGDAGSGAAPAAETTPVAPSEAPAAKPVEPTKPVPVAVQAVETENGVAYIAGFGAPGSKIILYLDDKPIGETTVDSTGRWLLESKIDVAPGSHKVRADHVGENGMVIARAEVPFNQVAPEVAAEPVAGVGSTAAGVGSGSAGEARVGESETVIIRRGDNLWTIAKRLYGRGVRYSTIYEANTDQIRNPDLIYPGQVFVLPEGDTNWQPVNP